MSVSAFLFDRCCAPLMCTLFISAVICGCGEARPPLAVAGGKVVCGGIAVTSGSITFVPIAENGEKNPGKAAKGEITGDGSFRLTTWDAFDGAVVGRHRVEFEASENDTEEDAELPADESEQEAAPSRRPAAAIDQFHLPGELILEVRSGVENQFNIELSPGKGPETEEE